MRRPPAPRRVTAVLAACAIAAAAAGCGDEDSDVTLTQEPGDTSTASVADAYATQGRFEVLPTAPERFRRLAGDASLSRARDGTTARVAVTGLPDGARLVGHVHEDPCDQDAGGEHFRFDPRGPAEPPNEIHLALAAGPDGTATAVARNQDQAPPGARSIVLHEAGDRAGSPPRVACADLS